MSFTTATASTVLTLLKRRRKSGWSIPDMAATLSRKRATIGYHLRKLVREGVAERDPKPLADGKTRVYRIKG